jgi:uncharacterized membrane protein
MSSASPPPDTGGMNRTLRENIAEMAEHRRNEQAAAPLSERISDRITAFAGSMRFVALHLILFGGWIAINIGWVPGVPRFDETLVVLAMAASVEAIFLSTFVLISQNRMMTAADQRADLDLHISLLTEHELTRLAALVERIANGLNVPVADPELEEIKQDVAATEVIAAIQEAEGGNSGG